MREYVKVSTGEAWTGSFINTDENGFNFIADGEYRLYINPAFIVFTEGLDAIPA